MLQEGGRISQKHLEGLPHLHPLLSQHRGHCHPHGHAPQPHPAWPAQEVKASVPRLAWEFLLLLPAPSFIQHAGGVCAMLSISQALGTQQGTKPSKVSTLGVSHSGRETSSKGKSK